MINIKKEADEIKEGKQPKDNNVLKNAPHPVTVLIQDDWDK
jgi:glycine dehydrogenase